MKIILCIFLLYITAVSVFGQSQELNGIVGKSIEFPAAVKTSGNLMYGSKAIGSIIGEELLANTDLEYKGRVHWDSSTRFFSLFGLRLKDSGVYTVNNTNGKTSVSFHLTVWKGNVPVSKPSITIPQDPCSILCTAKRGTGVTLTLYREGDKKRYISSDSLDAPYLNMTVPVENGTYTCEAKNSVSSEISDPLTVEPHCTVPVSKPSITIPHIEDPCSILCTAKRGTGVTLTLYRLGDKKRYISSDSLDAPYLNMTHSVESGTYTCEAKNSVSNETSDPLTVGDHCKAPSGFNTWMIVGIVVGVIVTVIVAVVLVVCLYRKGYCRRSRGRFGIRNFQELMAILRYQRAQSHVEAQEPGSQGL